MQYGQRKHAKLHLIPTLFNVSPSIVTALFETPYLPQVTEKYTRHRVPCLCRYEHKPPSYPSPDTASEHTVHHMVAGTTVAVKTNAWWRYFCTCVCIHNDLYNKTKQNKKSSKEDVHIKYRTSLFTQLHVPTAMYKVFMTNKDTCFLDTA